MRHGAYPIETAAITRHAMTHPISTPRIRTAAPQRTTFRATAGAFLLVLLSLGLSLGATPARAQFAIGAGYEMRSEAPTSGYMVMVETGIFGDRIPLFSLKLRFHYSGFSEQLGFDSYQDLEFPDADAFRDVTSSDFGVAAIAGFNLGLLSPYAGVGIGSETFKVDYSLTDAIRGTLPDLKSQDTSGLYWNGFVGSEVSPIPIIRPFVEYRFSSFLSELDLDDPDIDYTNNGRFTIGVKLKF